MKRYFVAFILFSILLLLRPSLSSAIFLIELKNGRTITADNYRREGNNIVLYTGTGEIKISRDEIKSISEEKEGKGAEKQEVSADPDRESRENPEAKETAKGLNPKEKDIDSPIKKKAQIQERLEEAKKVYFSAKDKVERDRARETMISISRELISFQEEVIKKNGGSLPAWWEKTPD